LTQLPLPLRQRHRTAEEALRACFLCVRLRIRLTPEACIARQMRSTRKSIGDCCTSGECKQGYMVLLRSGLARKCKCAHCDGRGWVPEDRGWSPDSSG
jgi:hypothetical protein